MSWTWKKRDVQQMNARSPYDTVLWSRANHPVRHWWNSLHFQLAVPVLVLTGIMGFIGLTTIATLLERADSPTLSENMSYFSLVYIALIAMVGLTIVGTLRRSVLRKIDHLKFTMDERAKGLREIRADESGHDELSDLARYINRMLDLMDQRKQEMLRINEVFKQSIEAVGTGVIVFSAGEEILAYNSRFAEMHPELAPELLIGRTFEEVLEAVARESILVDLDSLWVAKELAFLRDRPSRTKRRTGENTYSYYHRSTPDAGVVRTVAAFSGDDTSETLDRTASMRAVNEARSLRVLVAEDDSTSQTLARTLLESAGHVVTTVESGEQAVEAAAHEKFDVILIDCDMPGMGGFSAAVAIRKLGGGHRVPIIALAAKETAENEKKYQDAGIDDCVTKPLDVEELRRKLAIWGSKAVR